MNKVNGKKTSFAPIREDGSRITICYGLKKLSGDLYEWLEVYLPKSQTNALTLDIVKAAIIADINSRTDAKILTGFSWEGKPVWLSAENQRNFSEAQRMGVVPVTFKLGEDTEGNPVYHTFETAEEMDEFYRFAFGHIQQCLQAGWQEKDSIDWAPYEALFPSENAE